MLQRVIFIYNADAGRLAAMLDSVKKAAGSEQACSLCSITHGLFAEKENWATIDRSLGVSTEYFHRDDMPEPVRNFMNETGSGLPVVLLENNDGDFSVAVKPDELKACGGETDCLRQLLEKSLQTAGGEKLSE